MIKVKITKIKTTVDIINFDGNLEDLQKAIKTLNSICEEEYRFNVLKT